MVEDPHRTLAALAAEIRAVLGENLVGLYLFGSLAGGDFYPSRSDLDLFAVLAQDVDDDGLEALRLMHVAFEQNRPEWRDRIEVAYFSRAVLATFVATPTGRIVRISPGEPLHRRNLDESLGWLLDWHGALHGETVFGVPPADTGPDVSADRLRAAVTSQLLEMRAVARENTVAYVPAQQGYIVATVCRALYSLGTGEQTSKEGAIEWYADRNPDEADFVWSAYRAYRADIRGPHERLIDFVDAAAAGAVAGAG